MEANSGTILRPLFAHPHKAAALAYGGLGILVILLTFVAGLVPEGRENPVVELSIGAFFIVIFMLLIYRGWWLISAFLVVSNSWRVFTYVNDGLGRHVELLPYICPVCEQLGVLDVTRTEPQPVAFVNALLMVVIVIMLARSTWIGFTTWRGRRSPNTSETALDNSYIDS